MIDSHAHLVDPRLKDQAEEVLMRAEASGVRTIITIGSGYGPTGWEESLRLAERYPGVYATLGVHPHEAPRAPLEWLDELRVLLDHPKVVGVGEMGLDFYRDPSPQEREQQAHWFRAQAQLAAEKGLPVVIHTRNAFAATVALLDELLGEGELEGVIHFFTGSPEEGEAYLKRGLYLSFAGVLTFPKEERLRQGARIFPRDRVLIETDSPYAAPVPYRGKRNEPAYVVEVARTLSRLWSLPPEEVAAITAANTRRLFSRITSQP